MKKPDIWVVTERGLPTPLFIGSWSALTSWFEERPTGSDFLKWALITHCGCCGAHGRVLATLPCSEFGTDRFIVGDVSPSEVFLEVYRCEKHVGRLPCCIEGCGRTFAHKGDETYNQIVMCGAHYRQGAKRDRDLRAKVLRKMKRVGQTDRLYRLADKLWWKIHAAVTAGHVLDETEINAMFGWDQ